MSALTSGLLYLAALVLVQAILSFTYVRLAYYTSFQFMIMIATLIFLLLVLGLLNPFALKWDRRLELTNISIHTVMICVLTGCSVWGNATIDSTMSRQFVNGVIFGLLLLFILLNFGTIVYQAVVFTRDYHIRSTLERYYARIER